MMSSEQELSEVLICMRAIEGRSFQLIRKYKDGISRAPIGVREEYRSMVDQWTKLNERKLRLQELLLKDEIANQLKLLRDLMVILKADIDGEFKNVDLEYYQELYNRYVKL